MLGREPRRLGAGLTRDVRGDAGGHAAICERAPQLRKLARRSGQAIALPEQACDDQLARGALRERLRHGQQRVERSFVVSRDHHGARRCAGRELRILAQDHFAPVVVPCEFASGIGVWQPLQGASGPLCDPAPWVANAVPFLVQSLSQFRTAGPCALTSPQYAADLNEVETLGALNSTARSPEQTHLAAFWQGNPPANYNALTRRLADEHSLDVSQSALLFAMTDLTAADALINTWNDKYHWRFWRPWAAIHNAGDDGNPDTTPDPTAEAVLRSVASGSDCRGRPALIPRRTRSIRPGRRRTRARRCTRWRRSSERTT